MLFHECDGEWKQEHVDLIKFMRRLYASTCVEIKMEMRMVLSTCTVDSYYFNYITPIYFEFVTRSWSCSTKIAVICKKAFFLATIVQCPRMNRVNAVANSEYMYSDQCSNNANKMKIDDGKLETFHSFAS